MQDKYNFSAMSVLVVDESVFSRKLTVQMFRSFDFGFVREASSTAAGFEMYRSHDAEMVCVETIQGVMSGVELINTIRTSSESPNTVVPILATCSHPTLKNVSDVRDAGANELLAKPFSPGNMLDRLIYMIESPRQFVRADGFFGPDRRRLSSEGYTGEERRVAVDTNSENAEPSDDKSRKDEVEDAA